MSIGGFGVVGSFIFGVNSVFNTNICVCICFCFVGDCGEVCVGY